jgi:CRP-like cAMP-binding protein
MSAIGILSKGWVGDLPVQLGRRFCALGQQVSFGPGEIVYSAGEEANSLYGCLGGTLRLSFAGENGELRFVHLMGPGMWTGDFAFLSNQPRAFELRTSEAARLLRIDRGAVLRLAHEHPETWKWLAFCTACNLGLAMTVADHLMIRDAGQRLAATLLRLSARLGSHPSVAPIDRLLLTQSDLADAANLSLSATGRLLRSLHSQGLIDVSYGEIGIVNAPRLQSLVGKC